MTVQTVRQPFHTFKDIDGQPLENGNVYVGTAGLVANQNQVQVYWDAAKTQPATQPLSTRGGFIVNSGAISEIYVDADDYSLLVSNKNSATVYSALNMTAVYGTRTIPEKLGDVKTIKDFGAVGDGITDDSAAFQAAIDAGGHILFPDSGDYYFANTINLKTHTSIDFGGAVIKYNTGSNALFSINLQNNIILKGGKFESGTCGSLLYVVGSGTGASGSISYSRNIFISDMWVESNLTERIFELTNGVRQFFVNNCHFQSNNGVVITNKVVEVGFTNCLFFNNGATTGSKGFSITAPAGGASNPEGIFMSNSTVDFYDRAFEIGDVYTFLVSTCFIGGNVYSVEYIEPGTAGAGLANHIYTGCTFSRTGVKVGAFTGGRVLQFQWNGCEFNSMTTTTALSFEANSARCNVRGCRFVGNTGQVGIKVKTNVTILSVTDNYFDDTMSNAIECDAGVGGDLIFHNNEWTTASYASFLRECSTLRNGIEADTSISTLTGTPADAANLTGAVGGFLGRGDKGLLTIILHCDTTSAGTIDIIPNSGSISFPGGTSINIESQAGQVVSYTVPFNITADINANIQLQNNSGAAMTVNANSSLQLIKV